MCLFPWYCSSAQTCSILWRDGWKSKNKRKHRKILLFCFCALIIPFQESGRLPAEVCHFAPKIPQRQVFVFCSILVIDPRSHSSDTNSSQALLCPASLAECCSSPGGFALILMLILIFQLILMLKLIF